MKRSLYTIIVFFLLPNLVFGQIFITGKIIDKEENEGIPFVNVYDPDDPTQGTSTDIDGYYTLEVNEGTQSIEVTAIGYITQTKTISTENSQEINFRMRAENFTLEEAVVYAGEDPAIAKVKEMILKRKTLNINHFENYQCEVYSKTELDLKDIPEKLRNSKLMKPFAFVFENIDSTSEAEPFLPAFIAEEVSDRKYKKSNNSLVDQQKAVQISGIDNNSILSFVGQMSIDYSPYDDWINIVGKQFACPFGGVGLNYYNYYLYDSTTIQGKEAYRIKFSPRRKQENTFEGFFWLSKDEKAITQFDMAMSPGVNINLVSRVKLVGSYSFTDSLSQWVPHQKNLVVEFVALEEAPGIIGRKSESFKDYIFNNPQLEEKIKPQYVASYELKKDDSYWADKRHSKLTKNETIIYEMVDSIKNVPIYKTYADVLYTIFHGYKEFGKVEVGPYSEIYGNNDVEGSRVKLGVWTSSSFSKKIRFGGYGAYGFKDKKFKFGVDVKYLTRHPRTLFTASYINDLDINISNDTEINTGNFTGGLIRRKDIIQKLVHTKKFNVKVERHFPYNISSFLSFNNTRLDPYENIYEDGTGFSFSYVDDRNMLDSTINTSEVSLGLRWAHKEEFIDFVFERKPLPSKYPIFRLDYTLGLNNVLGSNYEYHKIDLYSRYWFNFKGFGWTRLIFRAGKIFGKVPFLLASVPPGNETYFQSFLAFNAMNRYEFAADQFVSLIYEHHFDGYILNKIPLVKKLKWRSVFTFKAFYGSLSEENKLNNRNNLFDVNKNGYLGIRAPDDDPYMEMGAGVENIFKVLRIDAIWRLNYLDNPEALPFSVKAAFTFRF